MRVSLCKWLGLAMLGGLAVACSDKSSNPDAVTVEDLKYPGNLTISDKGDGIVSLSWSGSNNEDDFDGYNVYGAAGSDDSLKVTPHEAIVLLDDKGEKIPAAETTLGLFNYDVTKGLGAVAPTAATGSAAATKDAPQFSALPIYRTDSAGDKLLPTCKVGSGGTCSMTTAANKDTTASSDPNSAANGKVTFQLPDTLTVGERYCFFVMASKDNGKKVSQTSSNVECVIPRYKLNFALTLPTVNTENSLFDLRGILTACISAGNCSDPGTTYVKAGDTTLSNPGKPHDHVASDAGPIYIEISSSVNDANIHPRGFVAGQGAAISDLGAYTGFDDSTLQQDPPVLVLDDTPIGGTGINKDAPVFNAGGYSVAGQTVPLEGNHVYVFAVGAPGAEGKGPFNYHWLFIDGTPAEGDPSVKVQMRLTKTAL